jgi:hypothetical protein
MAMLKSVPAQRPRRCATFGIWLGLWAVALHAFGPLLAPVFNAASSMPAAHAHDPGAHPHQHGAPDMAVEHLPPPPELVCVGDCPCCSLGGRALAVPARWLAVVLAPAAAATWPRAVLAAPRAFRPGTYFPSRAPPVSA